MNESNEKQIQFQYANECDLEIHCSPFGLSGLYIKIKGTNIIGIGSTMGLITGSSKGYIHYNDSHDLIDQKYKLYVVVDDDGTLRIDFTKIFTLTNGAGNTNESAKNKPDDDDKLDEEGLKDDKRDAASDEAQHAQQEKQQIQKASENPNADDVPTLVFTGKCPEGRPDKVEPFIGIFSFERED